MLTKSIFARLVWPAIGACASWLVPWPSPAAEPRLIADFEGFDYAGWKTEGNAFGEAPARGTLPGQQTVSGFLGRGLVDTFLSGDAATGTLTSPEFTLDRPFLNFLIGGGRHPGLTCVNLLVDGKVIRTATGTANTGADDEHLSWHSWDLGDLLARKARVQIVDRHEGSWGHVNVDHFVLEDQSRMPLLISADHAQAQSSVWGASGRAQADPARPLVHFAPPALWMNDPNGPLEYGGYYHLFYQHNPFGDRWEHMHWGHARSKDLVRWEHQPIALAPSPKKGEEHCFSGCATINGQGRPMIFYTSIGPDRRAGDSAEQWAALGDDDLTTWVKHPANPVLSERLHGSTKIYDWRDPFLFQHENQTYMVLGGNLNQARGGQAVTTLYRAENAALTEWKYLGVLFQHPDQEVKNIECPNFFRLGDSWVLIVSPHRKVEYFVGDFDPKGPSFRPRARGVLDGGDFYAPNSMVDRRGRRLLWGWINGFQPGRGWNGALTFPRVLDLAPDGTLLQRPADELSLLRVQVVTCEERGLDDESHVPAHVGGDVMGIFAEIDRGDAQSCGLVVRRSADGERGVEIAFDGRRLSVAGQSVPLTLPSDESLRLQVFLDKSVVEVFANDRAAVTKVVYPEIEDLGVAAFARGGRGRLGSLTAWRLLPVQAEGLAEGR